MSCERNAHGEPLLKGWKRKRAYKDTYCTPSRCTKVTLRITGYKMGTYSGVRVFAVDGRGKQYVCSIRCYDRYMGYGFVPRNFKGELIYTKVFPD